jgi:hypothetical protein
MIVVSHRASRQSDTAKRWPTPLAPFVEASIQRWAKLNGRNHSRRNDQKYEVEAADLLDLSPVDRTMSQTHPTRPQRRNQATRQRSALCFIAVSRPPRAPCGTHCVQRSREETCCGASTYIIVPPQWTGNRSNRALLLEPAKTATTSVAFFPLAISYRCSHTLRDRAYPKSQIEAYRNLFFILSYRVSPKLAHPRPWLVLIYRAISSLRRF